MRIRQLSSVIKFESNYDSCNSKYLLLANNFTSSKSWWDKIIFLFVIFIKVLARLEIVMHRIVVKISIIVSALPIFKAFKLNIGGALELLILRTESSTPNFVDSLLEGIIWR